jgi:hypothetical protein
MSGVTMKAVVSIPIVTCLILAYSVDFMKIKVLPLNHLLDSAAGLSFSVYWARISFVSFNVSKKKMRYSPILS